MNNEFRQIKFSRQDKLAFLAAILLRRTPKTLDKNWMSQIGRAFETAILILEAADIGTHSWFEENHYECGIWAIDEWLTSITNAYDKTFDTPFVTSSKAPDERITKLLLKAGWKNNDDPETAKMLPWQQFQPLMLPTKPSSQRLPRFRNWLLHLFNKNNQSVESQLSKLREIGLTKGQFLKYHMQFPDWWEKQLHQQRIAAGKLGVASRERAKKNKKRTSGSGRRRDGLIKEQSGMHGEKNGSK
jgi:hypothetical protein